MSKLSEENSMLKKKFALIKNMRNLVRKVAIITLKNIVILEKNMKSLKSFVIREKENEVSF